MARFARSPAVTLHEESKCFLSGVVRRPLGLLVQARGQALARVRSEAPPTSGNHFNNERGRGCECIFRGRALENRNFLNRALTLQNEAKREGNATSLKLSSAADAPQLSDYAQA